MREPKVRAFAKKVMQNLRILMMRKPMNKGITRIFLI